VRDAPAGTTSGGPWEWLRHPPDPCGDGPGDGAHHADAAPPSRTLEHPVRAGEDEEAAGIDVPVAGRGITGTATPAHRDHDGRHRERPEQHEEQDDENNT
jgi:hypothetical protein